MSTADPKPKRPRKTKAEREAKAAARAAKLEAEELAKYKPIDPLVWLILGALILFVAAWTWLDPTSLSNAGQPKDQSILLLIPDFLINTFSKNAAVLILTILGAIPFLSGLIGWLRKRFRKAPTL